jgi:hypothetical protein
MKKNYIGLHRCKETTGSPKKNGWLMGALAAATLFLGGSSYAQTNVANYSFAKGTGAPYTQITGTKLFPTGTNTSYDNEVSSAITLSSPFTFGGVPVTSIYVSANGFVTFGAAPDGINYTPLATLGTTTGAISAFGQDAGSSTVTGAVPEVSYLDSPTEFVVQYKDHANYYNRSTERLNFQIRLEYATGKISIVYGTNTNPGTSTSGIAPQVGIRGNSIAYATNVNPLTIGNVPSGTTCDWSKAVTGNSETSAMLFSGANVNVKIPTGLLYVWTPNTQLPVRTFAATTAVTNNGATLNWTAPTGAVSYNVQYRSLGSCDWTSFAGNPVSTTTVPLTGLTQNTTYQIQVQALNGNAVSTYSHIPNLAGTGNGYAAAGSFTTLANCASTVTGLTSSALTPDTATISWTASTTAPANGYEYYYSTSSTAPSSTTTPSGSVAAGVITANLVGLTPSTQYYYWVRGNCNGTDKGVWSSSANFTTLSLCPTVTAPVANAVGVPLTNPTITWTAVNGTSGYKVKVGTTSGANNIADADVVGGTSSSYQISATLSAATTYYYSVTAYTTTTLAPSTPCAVRNFITACVATNAPYTENFDTTAVGSTSNTNAPTCWRYLEPNGWAGYGYVSTTAFTSAPNGYYIYTDAATTGGGMLVSPQTTNLMNGNNRIRFFANAGGSSYTMEVGTLSDPTDASTFVAIGSPISLTTTMAQYTVNIPSGANQYIALRHAGGGTFRSVRFDDISVELIPSCAEPTSVTVSNIASTGATLTWTAPAAAPASGYQIYYSTTNTAPTATTAPTLSVTTVTTPLSTLTPATTYYVWVRSNCGSNQSVWTLMTSFTTLATPPANDNCSAPITITPGATFAQNPITGTIVGSTNTPALTATCLATPTNVGGNVWYTVVVPASGSLTIETAAVTGSPLTDTVVSVFTSCSSTTSIGCDDDSGTDAFSKLTLTGQTPGTTLYISVWKYSTATDGQFQISAYDASLATSETVQVKNDLKIYPNPFADVLNISDVKNVKSVNIVDIAGRLVKTIDKPSSALQLRDLNSGMYMVILNMNDGSKQTIKAIKK